MPYTKQTWVNGVAGGTPLSAARLQHVEDGLDATADVADGAIPATQKAVANGVATLDAGALLPEAQVPTRLTAAQLSASYASVTSLNDHLADTADAHDASAISFVPAGNIAATDVQSALAELDTEKKALVVDGCQITTAADLSVPTSTDTFIPGATEVYDTAGYHDTVTNNSRITIPSGKAGKYLLTGFLRYSANATGARDLAFYKNGMALNSAGGYITLPAVAGGGITMLGHACVAQLAVGDYLQLLAYQNSGATLTIPATWAVFTATYLGT